MIAHERSLVQKYAGKPFALQGVSAEESRQAMVKAEFELGLLWSSWWDGAEEDKISVRCGVKQFPTFMLFDAGGRLAWFHEGPPKEGELEKEIDAALAKMEAR